MTIDSFANAAVITLAILIPVCWVIGTIGQMLTGRE